VFITQLTFLIITYLKKSNENTFLFQTVCPKSDDLRNLFTLFLKLSLLSLDIVVTKETNFYLLCMD